MIKLFIKRKNDMTCQSFSSVDQARDALRKAHDEYPDATIWLQYPVTKG